MRVSEKRKKRRKFCERIGNSLRRIIDRSIDVLAKPIEALDRWLDRYDRGYNDGVEKGVDISFDYFRGKHKVIREKCLYIESVITELELNYPELHTEVDSIDKAVSEIRRQVR